jgi:penicillin-binding protein 2
MPLFDQKPDLSQFKLRYLIMLLLATLATAILTARIYSLQVTHGGEYQEQSRDNFVSERRQLALRGMVFDRNHSLLADNRPSFDLYFTPAFCRKEAFDPTLARLTEILGLSDEEIVQTRVAFEETKKLDRFLPYLVRRNMLWTELAMVEQNLRLLDGVEVRAATRRAYPRKRLAAHLLGYVGEISPAELAKKKEEDYRQGDVIGRSGVERAWEDVLRGRNGLVRVVVDARGQKMPDSLAREVLGGDGVVEPALPGNNLVLSIDARLQALAEERFPGREGAVVAIDPQTGFLLAMVSKPAYDPNQLSGRADPRIWRELVENIDRPLTNRATQQHYPPGSTFKPFTGLAALASGNLSAEDKETCTGGIRFGGHLFRCWRARGHGRVEMHRALVQSCDVYFYRAGLKAGIDQIASMSRSFGFGTLSGFESCQEVPGIIPDRQWYERNTQWGFLPGFTLSNSIGQGDVNVTPMQLAFAYAALANGGILYKPQVVERIESPTGELVQRFGPIERGRVVAKAEHLEIVFNGLVGVTNEPSGTAYYRRPRKVDFLTAGKTGTAQVVKQGDDRGKDLPYDFRDHAWFAGWAPAVNPRIAVAVVHEHGGHGSSGAAPLVMELITYYLVNLDRPGDDVGLPPPGADGQPEPPKPQELDL